MDNDTAPGLFGISQSNKNFLDTASWGKNQFNNTFPAALVNFMHSKDLPLIYLKINHEDFSVSHHTITVPEFFNADPASDTTYFAFESQYHPYTNFVSGSLPRVDLVVRNGNDDCAPIEIKLTALPDDQTSDFSDEDYGSEIVVRPDTIVYLALSIIEGVESLNQRHSLLEIFEDIFEGDTNWLLQDEAETKLQDLVNGINSLITTFPEIEKPLLLQPIWKTKGKSSVLADHCLDAFVWSNFAFTRLFTSQINENGSITRPERTVIWLGMMLYEFAKNGTLDHQLIIDTYTYSTKNDKAFAVGGLKTREYMRCEQLTTPRIKREEIPQIILGNGQRLLSPERRFDAVVQSTVELFEELVD
jgi:hypothetical protein